MSRSVRPTIGILVSHPIQYQAPWFRRLSERFELTVYYMHRQDRRGQAAAGFGVEFEWDVDLLAGYRYEWLDNVARRPGIDHFFGCDTPGIYRVLSQRTFDAFVIFGWNHKSALQAIAACRRAKVPVLMRGDSQLRTPRSHVWSVVKYPLYRALLPRIEGHLYVGDRNREYLAFYGVPDERLFFVPHGVDDQFAINRSDGSARTRIDSRRAIGIPAEAFVVLFVGKLIEKKRPLDLVRAVTSLSGCNPSIHALVVGDGPLRAVVEQQRGEAVDRIHLAGFRNQKQMTDLYRLADALVLPSDGRETWGLVVNEAMACGIPAIVADDVGCSPDLIDDGRTGLRYPTGDVAALANSIETMCRLSNERGDEIKAAIADKMRIYSLDHATAGLQRAVATVR